MSKTECRRYTVLNDAGRRTSQGSSVRGKYQCDTTNPKDLNSIKNVLRSPGWVGPAWFRFTYPAGTRIPESSPGPWHCGTYGTGWLSGRHPSSLWSSSNVKFCFDDGKNACHRSSQGKVTNCGSYYVYYLPNVGACRNRYCTTN